VTPDTAALLARWIDLAAGVAVVGGATLLLLAGPAARPTAIVWERRTLRWMLAGAVAGIAAGLVLLAAQAARLTDRPEAALDPATLGRVLLETRAGHVQMARQGLLLLLAAFLAASPRIVGRLDWVSVRGEALLLGGAALAAAAAAGHAAAVRPDAARAMAVDAAHLVAAGAWLGALVPLALIARAAGREEGADARPWAVLVARRFSRVALLAVLALAATGAGNAAVHVGSVAALVGTPYGRLLLLKLALLAGALALAVVGRCRLLPRLGGEAAAVGRPAMRSLALFAGSEAALGLALLGVVAAMTATPPARHEQPAWPLGFRLSLAPLEAPGLRVRALVGSQLALLGVVAGAAAPLVQARRRMVAAGALALLAAGLALAVPPLVVEAYPTTYARPAVRYHAASIARGVRLAREHCAGCHDAARAVELRSPRLDRSTAGDLFWRITAGIPGRMPAFGDRLDEEARWDLVNAVRALRAGEAARSLGPTVDPHRPWLVAPDFTFAVGPTPARSLRDYRGRRIVLLVLYDLPASRPRLAQLARDLQVLAVLGVEVVAVPRDADPDAIRRLGGEPRTLFPVVTGGARAIVEAYDLFGPAPHAEFLIDRQGYIRARWTAQGEPRRDLNLLLAEVQQLNEEQAPAAPADEHVH
jgi:putative copper resistance protein D